VARVHAALASSAFLRDVAAVGADGGRTFGLGAARVRPLFPEEVARLESAGNTSGDWSRVRVSEGFDWRCVRDSHFGGDVLLGRLGGEVRLAEGVSVPAGVFRSTVVDGVVGDDALVRDVKLLARCVLGPGAVLFDCGEVVCDGPTAFGNGAVLPLGPETGGREVAVYAEIDVETAAAVARSRGRRDLLARYAAAVAIYAARARSTRVIVGPGASLRHVSRVRNAYVGAGARVDGATLVEESTLLGDPDEPAVVESGACVTGSLLQWGSRASTLALVTRTVLAEQSYAERHAKATDSILGSNTGLAAGEVTASLVGPFVGLHHQALLIAALWPEGKGNVGYGANVGSNHTGKAPDQEFLPGEGLFLGLGVNVKYPADFSRSPYTIVACGVTTLPQRLAFPFSLVNLPAARPAGVPPAYNQLVPAWLLTDNLFAVRRNEAKFRARNRARRTPLETEVFRPAVVEMMRDAARRLEGVAPRKDTYTERDVEGLGKNYLLEEDRVAAVEAYRFFTRLYALLGLAERAREALARGGPDAAARLLAPAGGGQGAADRWEHQRRILAEDFGETDVAAALRGLPDALERVARCVEHSKGKDDERGRKVISDYADAHVPAAQDPFVLRTWEETARRSREVERLLERLADPGPPPRRAAPPADCPVALPAPAPLPHSGAPA
jgi:hypothetical protein